MADRAILLTIPIFAAALMLAACQATPVSQASRPVALHPAAATEALHPIVPAATASRTAAISARPLPLGNGTGAVAIHRTRPGSTLETTLRDWARSTPWRIEYRTRNIYDIASEADFPGDFRAAAGSLIHALGNAIPAPVITFHSNNVAVVTSQDADDAF